METEMKYENSIYPNKEQLKGFTEGDHGKPISMVNMLKFKENLLFLVIYFIDKVLGFFNGK